MANYVRGKSDRETDAVRAVSMAKGLCCSGCQIYFINLHGFPVLCEHCFKRPDAGRKFPGIKESTIRTREMGDL